MTNNFENILYKSLDTFSSITKIPIVALNSNKEFVKSIGVCNEFLLSREFKNLTKNINSLKGDSLEFSTLQLNSEEKIAFKSKLLNNSLYYFLIGPFKYSNYSTIDTCYNDLAFRSELSIHYICKILDMVIEDNILKKNHCLSLPTRRAIEYMHKSYKQNITLTSIAKHLGLNKCYFCNIFKKETNMTFSQFLNNLRIEKSKVLLKNTQLSLLDIAVEVGFNNQSYFTMAFKKLNADKTPLEYRRNLYLT